MPQVSGKRTRWLAILAGLAQLPLLWACSATVPSSRKYVGPFTGPRGPTHIEKSFPDLWEMWTVYLDPAKRAGGPLTLGNPFATDGGQGGPGREFPLRIAATLMDTTLIEAGLRHYAALLKMPPEEQANFRLAYSQRYDTEDHLLIWCQLSTTWAELHLDLDRWTIFIEDDAMNQYEPAQVLEEPRPDPAMGSDNLSEFGAKLPTRESDVHQKTLMLCFLKRDPLMNPVLSPDTQFLKLIFLLTDDENTRAEGVWVFRQ
jgi:hypothetical protein